MNGIFDPLSQSIISLIGAIAGIIQSESSLITLTEVIDGVIVGANIMINVSAKEFLTNCLYIRLIPLRSSRQICHGKHVNTFQILLFIGPQIR